MAEPAAPRRAIVKRRLTGGQVLGLVLVVVSLAAIAFAARSQVEQDRADARQAEFQQCINRQFDQLTRSLRARTESSTARTDAQDALIEAFLHAKTVAEVQRIGADWEAKKAAAALDRDQNPYPEPPTDTCGPEPN